MSWFKRGFLFKSDNFAQMPKGIMTKDGLLRIFYSSRNGNNQSIPCCIDVDPKSMEIVHEYGQIAELGELGAFDSDGVMPCQVVPHSDGMKMYYVGWQRTQGAPYRTTIGAMSVTDSVAAYQDRDVMATGAYGCTTMYFDNLNDVAYYAVYQGWRDGDPIYNIPQVAHLHQDSCTCAPVVLRDADGNQTMYYSVRRINDFRTNKDNSYSVARAVKIGDMWMPCDPGIRKTANSIAPDHEMICYADIIHTGTKFVMLYNGNDFGKHGILYAEAEAI